MMWRHINLFRGYTSLILGL